MKQNVVTLVVGNGQVGGALATVLERSFEVLRHDIEPLEFSNPIGVMHLCFPFDRPDTFERTALTYIQRFKPQLTIINSTVIPGTTRKISRQVESGTVAFSPVRGKHARMVEDLGRYVKFIAAPDENAAAQAGAHFRDAGMRTQRVGTVETLELAKLAETSYLGLLVAYAQELNRWAQLNGADYEDASDFFDEIDFLPRTRFFPGLIGGHCVIPNIKLLQRVVESKLLDGVLFSNELRQQELQTPASDGSTTGV